MSSQTAGLQLDQPVEPWISNRHVQRAAAYLAARGFDADAWLAKAKLAPGCLHDGDGWVSLVAVESLVDVAVHQFDEPHFGLSLAHNISPASFGVLGHLFQACSTLGDLLTTMTQFNGLMSNVGRSSMQRGPGTVTMSWACLAGGPLFRAVAAEFILGACCAMARTLAPRLPNPIVVRFQHGAPNAHAQERLAQHFDCPVHMQQPDNAVVLASALMDVRLPHGDAELKALLELRARKLLAARSQLRGSLLDDAKRHIRLLMVRGQPIVRQELAQRLGMSESTFHRRLQDKGTSFQDVVDAVRLQAATHTLAQGSVSASAIANRLGFSSPQVFTRWFQRQTGLTPGRYRDQALSLSASSCALSELISDSSVENALPS